MKLKSWGRAGEELDRCSKQAIGREGEGRRIWFWSMRRRWNWGSGDKGIKEAITYRVGRDESGHAVGDVNGVSRASPRNLHLLDVEARGGPLGREVVHLRRCVHGDLCRGQDPKLKLCDAWRGKTSDGQACSNFSTTTRPRRLARFGCFDKVGGREARCGRRGLLLWFYFPKIFVFLHACIWPMCTMVPLITVARIITNLCK